jgi:hypothetical protein
MKRKRESGVFFVGEVCDGGAKENGDPSHSLRMTEER